MEALKVRVWGNSNDMHNGLQDSFIQVNFVLRMANSWGRKVKVAHPRCSATCSSRDEIAKSFSN